jgi:hypothetical protein
VWEEFPERVEVFPYLGFSPISVLIWGFWISPGIRYMMGTANSTSLMTWSNYNNSETNDSGHLSWPCRTQLVKSCFSLLVQSVWSPAVL